MSDDDLERVDPRFWLCVVCAVIRRDDQVLLVRQQGGPHHVEEAWALPGGVVEHGESFEQALVREVREETGLAIAGPSDLLWVVEASTKFGQSLAFVFGTTCDDTADPCHDDPDGLIREASWIPMDIAIERLGRVTARRMAEPAVEVLSGRSPTGTLWSYRANDADEDLLQGVVSMLRDVASPSSARPEVAIEQ